MADIEMIIKISEDDLKSVEDTIFTISEMYETTQGRIYRSIVNGISLPKGHGKIIDVSDLITTTEISEDGNEVTYVLYDEIDNAQAIIEGNNEEEKIADYKKYIMTDYRKYINALRKCAKEHETDNTSTGHIIVSDLCHDTANLLESLGQETKSNSVSDKLSNVSADVLLDKIETDVKQLTARYTVSRECCGMGHVEWSDRLIKEDDILQIINKYRTESEDD